MANTKTEVPYALVPDYNGYPDNSPLKTFEGEISDEQFNILSEALTEDMMMPDGFIIKERCPELFECWMQQVKSLNPNWGKYAGIEIYIPEICHIKAQLLSMLR